MRLIQLPMFSASRRISVVARPAFFWKAVIGSAERTGGVGGVAEFRDGTAVVARADCAGRTEVVAETRLERLTSSMGGWVEGDDVAFDPPRLLLTSWIGGKAAGRGAGRAVRGAGVGEAAALGAVDVCASRPDGLLVRGADESVFLAGGAERAIVAVGAGGFGADFATGGAFGGTTGAGTVTGVATDDAALALFAAVTAVGGAALAVFSLGGFLVTRAGVDRSTTAGALDLCGVASSTAGGAVAAGCSAGSVSRGESASSRAPAVDLASGFAIGSVVGSAGGSVLAVVSVGVAAGDSAGGPGSVVSAGCAVAFALTLSAEGSGALAGSVAGGSAAILGASIGAAGAVTGGGWVARSDDGDASRVAVGSVRSWRKIGWMTTAQAKAPAKPSTPARPAARRDQVEPTEELARRGCRFGGVSGGGANPFGETNGTAG